MRGRTYDPVLRRFLQPDPVIQDAYAGQNYNRYSYVMNDPVNLTDPTGYESEEDPLYDDLGGGWYGRSNKDGSGAQVTSDEIVVTASPVASSTVTDEGITVVSGDTSGDGSAVKSEGGKGAYEGSSTGQGGVSRGRGGSGRGAGRMCDGCSARDWSSVFLVYGPSVEKGLLYMSAGTLWAAAAVAALPAMAIGGLVSGGTGLIGGVAAATTAPAAVQSTVTAATSVAALARTPTGQAVLEKVEGSAATAGQVLSKSERLGKYFEQLEKSPSARNAEEALQLISDTLDRVENMHSGVEKVADPGLKYVGRMYPPMADNISRLADGGMEIVTRGNRIFIDPDGAFRVFARATGELVFGKSGAQ